jgi:hypothetical protein
MGFKKERLGPRLVEAARGGERYRDVHVFFGGTGAVGGTAVLELLSMYEEMFAIAPPADDDIPIIVATGTSREEIEVFTNRMFRFLESRHGSQKRIRVRNGYLTHSGVFVALERFEIDALPALKQFAELRESERRAQLATVLERMGARAGAPPESIGEALAQSVPTNPFTGYLNEVREQWADIRAVERFRSVLIGIPVPSLLAYHERNLEVVAEQVDGFAEEVEKLKERFLDLLVNDLARVRDCSDNFAIAHTTAVGGMYDEVAPGKVSIRLGFAHSAHDEKLVFKQQYAESLTRRYAKAGLNVLITAAAIGIDEVKMGERLPLHRTIRQMFKDTPDDELPISGSRGRAAGKLSGASHERPARVGQYQRSFEPITVPLDETARTRVEFSLGEEIRPAYALRSGENGFFTVANAEALYRVMRVASSAELGLVLARLALLGDDPLSPWFPGHVCYYTESDNSRQVFDFLAQDRLRRSQLSGLDPMALQDLGSAKHQGELHTLALFVLLHRLRTFDVSAIDPYVELKRFDAATFFVEHSFALTLDDVSSWEAGPLSADLRRLVTARTPTDLEPLLRRSGDELFARRQDAKRLVLDRVLHAVWAIPSLGSPFVYTGEDGNAYVRTGYYIAPLELLFAHRSDLADRLRADHRRSRNPCSYATYRDYNLAVGGFIDVRPHAILCSASNDSVDLRGRVRTVRAEEDLRSALAEIEPYGFFATCGLVAVLFRLRALYRVLQESMTETGTLQTFRWQMPRDAAGRLILVPGIVEALRMVSEGLEKTTGTERLDGMWGYERRTIVDRSAAARFLSERESAIGH